MARKFAALTARIEALQPRVAGMQTHRIEPRSTSSGTFCRAIAVDELKAQRDRLNTYMIQARFALASIYDERPRKQYPHADELIEAPKRMKRARPPTLRDGSLTPLRRPSSSSRSGRTVASRCTCSSIFG